MSGFTVQNGQVTTIGIWAGDVVTYQGKRYKVVKVNPKNYRVTDEKGTQYNLRIHPSVTRAEDQSWDGPEQKTEYQKYVEAVEKGLHLGTVVRITSPKYKHKYPHDYVIVQTKSDGTFRMAKLGGDGGRYLRGFTADDLEVVTL